VKTPLTQLKLAKIVREPDNFQKQDTPIL